MTRIIYPNDITNILFSMLSILVFIGCAICGIFLMADMPLAIPGITYTSLIIGIFGALYIRAGVLQKEWRKHAIKLTEAMASSDIIQSHGDDRGMVANALKIHMSITSENTLYRTGQIVYTELLLPVPIWKNWPLYHEAYSIFCCSLPRPVPNMVLVAQHGAMPPDAKEYTRLEGDFGNYFSVFAPEQYHRDARIILTPNVMDLLRDFEGSNIEFIDNMLVVYAPLVSPGAIRTGAMQLAAIQKAAGRNAEHYQDEMGNQGSLSIWSKRLRWSNEFPISSLIAIALTGALTTLYALTPSSATMPIILVAGIGGFYALASIGFWWSERNHRKKIDSLYKEHQDLNLVK